MMNISFNWRGHHNGGEEYAPIAHEDEIGNGESAQQLHHATDHDNDDDRPIDVHRTDDESSNSSRNFLEPSWMWDDLEGPNEDDIWVERDEDHARNVSALLQKELKEKKVQHQKMKTQDRAIQRAKAQIVEWWTDEDEQGETDLLSKHGSDNEDVSHPVWKENIDMGT